MRMMMASLERQYSLLAQWSPRLGGFALVLFVMSAFAHREGLIETVPFLLILGLCFLLALGGVISAVAGFHQFWKEGAIGLGSAVLGALLSLLVLFPYAFSGYRAAVHPQLTDVATDVWHPPLFQNAGALRRPPMNPLGLQPPDQREQVLQAYPELVGRRYERPQETVLETVLRLVDDRRWDVIGVVRSGEPTEGVTVEALARTYLLGFPNDVAIRVEDRGGATFVDMRSASRYGRHDLGDNAMRIRRFLTDLDDRMKVLPR